MILHINSLIDFRACSTSRGFESIPLDDTVVLEYVSDRVGLGYMRC